MLGSEAERNALLEECFPQLATVKKEILTLADGPEVGASRWCQKLSPSCFTTSGNFEEVSERRYQRFVVRFSRYLFLILEFC